MTILNQSKGIGGRNTVKVLRSQSPLPFNEITSGISFSGIERGKKGIITLFMCHVSKGCPNPEVQLHRDATRMDFDFTKGEIRLWKLAYNARKPDVVIENAVPILRQV